MIFNSQVENKLFERGWFLNGEIKFTAPVKPVSSQNNSEQKQLFRKQIHQITTQSEFIITGTCWVAIDYYCQHIRRQKNPGVYDMDNIVKPILDSLVGINGLILDDVLVDRVTVNWIDTPHDDHIEVEIQYPDLIFVKKTDLVIIKSDSGWCWPVSQQLLTLDGFSEMAKRNFNTWDSIKSEDDYYALVYMLPIQPYLYFSKIKDKNYTIVDLSSLDAQTS
ncbi:MAG: RusA family crossover junction endodeoxyribonuclease [Methylicorpusculum sp.]|uniref:RusA family crossover junction endodeoxyribonuclease n=1 Tax=Methylicorpusculum sp. TaxID=2713644 RepID=UPI002718D412|nr:RusA family crossover junction endodeoxyribonuclease [Methylicorpusculum sp.]MDO8937744.1 RusA family crossover junction endodeoxyribonuclease [Methylicorpusculum sp.]